MRIDVLTLFPEMLAGPLDVSILKRARATGLLDLRVHNLRDWTHDRYKTVDDRPFGGGPGMVLKPEPIFEAVEALAAETTWVVLTTPAGRVFNQAAARGLAQREHLLFICGGYEGVDERVHAALVDEEGAAVVGTNVGLTTTQHLPQHGRPRCRQVVEADPSWRSDGEVGVQNRHQRAGVVDRDRGNNLRRPGIGHIDNPHVAVHA